MAVRMASVHGSAPKKPTRRRRASPRQAGLLDRLRQVERVRGRAAEHRAPEVLEGDELPVREAARHRDHRGAQRLRPVVEAEAAREEAVAVRVLHDVARAHAARPKRPAHHLRPDVEVPARVGDDGRLPGGPGRGVDAHDLVHRHREEAERVRVAEVRLRRERQPPEIVERADPVGSDPGGREPVPVEGHAGRALHERAEALELEPPELGSRQGLDRRRQGAHGRASSRRGPSLRTWRRGRHPALGTDRGARLEPDEALTGPGACVATLDSPAGRANAATDSGRAHA